jgi:hypothetical protein
MINWYGQGHSKVIKWLLGLCPLTKANSTSLAISKMVIWCQLNVRCSHRRHGSATSEQIVPDAWHRPAHSTFYGDGTMTSRQCHCDVISSVAQRHGVSPTEPTTSRRNRDSNNFHDFYQGHFQHNVDFNRVDCDPRVFLTNSIVT